MTESTHLGGAGRNEGVPLRDEATREAAGVCGERRLVFIHGFARSYLASSLHLLCSQSEGRRK